jgi:mannose-6-phosphate isomerase-like protein (cupin superfamily)
MAGYVKNIEEETLANENFRKVLFTAPHSQLVVMSLLSGEDIGKEVHEVDQFIKIEEGNGKVVLNGEETAIGKDFAIMIPAGTEHNVLNGPEGKMKLYTVYSPPEHPDGKIHKTKAEALADETDHL